MFDLDGTLVDTDAHHFAATQQALERFGVTISQDYYAEHICGGKNQDIVRRLLPGHSPARRRDYVETSFRRAGVGRRPGCCATKMRCTLPCATMIPVK